MGVIDIEAIAPRTGTIYPEPYAALVAGRATLRLGDAGGLTQFGANITILPPGAMSSLRHWHRHEDEFVMVTQGELVLVQDDGERLLRAGDCAAFPAGDTNGHHFINRGGAEARFLVVGARAPLEVVTYSDVDMVIEFDGRAARVAYRDGSEWKGPR